MPPALDARSSRPVRTPLHATGSKLRMLHFYDITFGIMVEKLKNGYFCFRGTVK